MADADADADTLSSQAAQKANGPSRPDLEHTADGGESPASFASSSSLPSGAAVVAAAAAMGPRQPGSGTTTVTLNAPNPAVSYGGINPEIEESVHLVESVSEHGLRGTSLSSDKKVESRWERHFSPMPRTTSQDPTPHYVHQTSESDSKNLLTLPSELIDTIFSYLTPIDLATVSAVCHALRTHAISDLHWQRHVLSNLPGHKINSPYPCESWRELYATHDPYWFLTKHKIWFCDRELTGQMIIVRYDERRGCIEGYQLLATRARDGSEPWVGNQGVQIHYFEPRVKLHLDKPILQFNALSLGWDGPPAQQPSETSSAPSRLSSEHPMHMHYGSDPRFSNFLLAKPLPDFRFSDTNLLFPYGYVWPPPAIPARHRLSGKPAGIHHFSTTLPSLGEHRGSRAGKEPPLRRSEISDQTFQIRQWMEMGPPHSNVHLGEEIVSYSTLDPLLYTPTAEKPWRGLWVGDYSGHGCEFLLINQPDGADEDFQAQAPLEAEDGETEADFQERFRHERVYRGRLEAIKLTGDPNVPRGEYTFVADDLGEGGFVGLAPEAPFQGARVVKSKGHIAAMGFFDDKYIESQLILLSHNRLAQHWVSFGHISFYERVDIDQFLVPK